MLTRDALRMPPRKDHTFWADSLYHRALSQMRSAAFVAARLVAMSDYGRARSAERLAVQRARMQSEANEFLSRAMWHAGYGRAEHG